MHDNCVEGCSHGSTLYDQSLSEMEFERGIWQAALDDDVDKMKQLLQKGYDINSRDTSGYTALHYAARNKHKNVVRFLLEYNACVNCVTKSGRDSPLHRAAYVGDLNIVKMLVEKKATLDLQNSDGQTCLHKAVQNEHVDVIQYLLSVAPHLKEIRDIKNKIPEDYSCNDNIV